ncbi:hypothetical protein FB566_3491 [Stackebrandtia endophytica]|uniref:Uncharacterized protein n=1 Tax=Stackebrandtia endophytica TaxID=1496996 RepID=A0A543AZA9_9ACTN|nr:hypothetical protein [Stackebrandtia endophytica]TQL77917.1 hypothetical protein FB566_3491 [Stackebrandtia endophytica]
MKKITRLADSVLERLVRSSTASASKDYSWTECRVTAYCAMKGVRERFTCIRREGIPWCASKGCNC